MKKKYVTIEDIAEKTGKSITTISRVLNNRDSDGIPISEKTREIILKAVKELNYVPNLAARTLSQKNSMAIGLIVPDIVQIYFSQLCYYISREAEEKNYIIILSHSYENFNAERKALEMLVSRRVDGVILAPCMGDKNLEYIEMIQQQHIPVVLIDRYFKDSANFISISSDDVDGAYHLVRHLIENGSKKIAFIMGDKNTSISIERLAGYKKALKEAKLDFDKELIIKSNYFQEDGYKTTIKLIKKYKLNTKSQHKLPDTVIAVNDLVAIGVLDALEEYKIKVPEQIKVAGYGNLPFLKFFKTPLTSVDQSIKSIAKEAVTALLQLMNGEEIKVRNIKLPCTLVTRESTLKK